MRQRTAMGAALVVVLLIGGTALAGHQTASWTDTSTIYYWEGGDTGGKSVITRTPAMVTAVLEAEDLEPGDAHTVWWIVFNDPGECVTAFECAEVDVGNLFAFGDNDPDIRIGNATGNLAKADGSAEFGGVLREGVADGHQILFAGGADHLLADAEGAEIHFVIQTHGNARGGKQLLRQLSEVEYGCTPACADIQFSIHRVHGP